MERMWSDTSLVSLRSQSIARSKKPCITVTASSGTK